MITDHTLLLLRAQIRLCRITPDPYPVSARQFVGLDRVTATEVHAAMHTPWVQPEMPPDILGCIAGWISEGDE